VSARSEDSHAPPSRGELLAAGLLAIVVGLIVVFAFRVLFVLFAGVLLSLLLGAAARWVARVTRLPYVAAVAALVLLGIAGVVVSSIFFVPKLVEQLETMARDLPGAVEQLKHRLHHVPLVKDAVPAGDPGKLEPGKLATIALPALGGSIEILSGLVVAFFIGVYGAAQPEVCARAAVEVAPRRYRRHVQRALADSAKNLTHWLLGRLLAMLFVGVTTSLVFHFLHVPLALTLGTFAGFLTFIEYAGAVISAVPPVLLAFSQSTTTAVAVLVAYVVLHVVEGYVLTPLLARASVHLPPAYTLAAQAVLGELAGVLGLTFSTPLFVVAVSAVQAWRREAEHERSSPPDSRGAVTRPRRVAHP
jgi:predicted PurR-regulated permease PerM